MATVLPLTLESTSYEIAEGLPPLSGQTMDYAGSIAQIYEIPQTPHYFEVDELVVRSAGGLLPEASHVHALTAGTSSINYGQWTVGDPELDDKHLTIPRIVKSLRSSGRNVDAVFAGTLIANGGTDAYLGSDQPVVRLAKNQPAVLGLFALHDKSILEFYFSSARWITYKRWATSNPDRVKTLS